MQVVLKNYHDSPFTGGEGAVPSQWQSRACAGTDVSLCSEGRMDLQMEEFGSQTKIQLLYQWTGGYEVVRRLAGITQTSRRRLVTWY